MCQSLSYTLLCISKRHFLRKYCQFTMLLPRNWHVYRSQRISFLRALEIILDLPYPLHDPLLLARLSKAILLSLSTVLVIPSETSQSESISASNNTKGKKRARRYEGDEVFKISREVICKTSDDGNVILAAVRSRLQFLWTLPLIMFTRFV